MGLGVWGFGFRVLGLGLSLSLSLSRSLLGVTEHRGTHTGSPFKGILFYLLGEKKGYPTVGKYTSGYTGLFIFNQIGWLSKL